MSAYGLIDIGGTKLLAALGADDGVSGPPARVPTPTERPLEVLCALLDEARAEAPLDAIAIAVPGPFDRAGGRLLDPPGMGPAWHGLTLRDQLHQRYRCEIHLENDANCAAVAESVYGAGRGHRTVVYYTVSTGIGSGVIRDRRIVTGRHDTEGGHQVLWPSWRGGPACDCGGAGCLETLASGRAIERRFGCRAENLDDPAAWEDIGRWLGLAAVNATTLIDPDCIVFGGGVCAAWDRFAPALHATVATHLRLQPAPPIVAATLGVDRNLWGALHLITG